MREETLRDGGRVLVRSIEPDDRAALADAFQRLSPESRYRRFFAPVSKLTGRQLDYLTRVDHHDHEALVALDPDSRQIVGVTRFVRTDGETAEPAMVVADDWQHRGVARLLLDALADRAREEGIKRFDAPVLAGNQDAIHALERLGTTRVERQGREVELHIELPPAPAAGAGERVRAILAEFARGSLEPARTVLDLLWPRRRGAPGDPRRNAIVVGTDGSPHAEAAVEAAAVLADATAAVVDVVGVHRFLLPDHEDVAATVTRTARGLRDRGLHVHEHLRRGEPALVLTDVAAEQDARLLVVGAGDHGKAVRRVLGSVADLVAERAPCDVLIVRPTG